MIPIEGKVETHLIMCTEIPAYTSRDRVFQSEEQNFKPEVVLSREFLGFVRYFKQTPDAPEPRF